MDEERHDWTSPNWSFSIRFFQGLFGDWRYQILANGWVKVMDCDDSAHASKMLAKLRYEQRQPEIYANELIGMDGVA